MYSETLAIIDLGTNTFHLLFAEINERDDFNIQEKFKVPVKLGEGGITAGKIANKAFQRGITALKKYKKLIDSRRASKVFAFATSAIRSASNGQEFIQKAKEVAGIDIKIINGNEEAALIFEGVKSGIQLPYEKNSLIVDIGGGSVEFIVSCENKARLLRSLNIGAARLLEMFAPADPIKSGQVKEIQAFLREQMKGLLEELKEFDLSLMVGSSGSFETIGNIIALEKKDKLAAENLNSYGFSAQDFNKIHSRLLKLSKKQRLEVPGMDPIRVDMIIMGSLLVDILLKELKIKEITISSAALKEGILARFISEKKERIRHILGPSEQNIRTKAVQSFAKKFQVQEKHVLKVVEYCSFIFDQLHPLHKFGQWEAELLKYAAMLHDIGKFLNRSGHHKHGQYFIMNSSLSGFSNDELVYLGNIVRYHRKSLPTREHFHFNLLPQKDRLLVRTLAGILRIADHLDLGHRHLIFNIKLEISVSEIVIFLYADKELDIEMAAANGQKTLLEQVFSRSVRFEQVISQ